MATTSSDPELKQDTQTKGRRRSRWRDWLLDPLLSAGLTIGSILLTAVGAAVLAERSVPIAWIAGFVYTGIMPNAVLARGRAIRGYSIFDPVVRQALPKLIALHLLFLSFWVSMIAIYNSTSPHLAFAREFCVRHPRVVDSFIFETVIQFIAQLWWSRNILDNARGLLQQDQRASS